MQSSASHRNSFVREKKQGARSNLFDIHPQSRCTLTGDYYQNVGIVWACQDDGSLQAAEAPLILHLAKTANVNGAGLARQARSRTYLQTHASQPV